jgi:hypothetical protein
MSKNRDSLIASLSSLSNNQQDALLITRVMKALDEKYRFTGKKRLKVVEEMKKQEQRLLKKDGIIIHSDIA